MNLHQKKTVAWVRTELNESFLSEVGTLGPRIRISNPAEIVRMALLSEGKYQQRNRNYQIADVLFDTALWASGPSVIML
jgi:hypothetical protein